MANEYTTIAHVKSRLDITDTDDDDEILSVIEAVSRAIDHDRRRNFFASGEEARYYKAAHGSLCAIDDLISLTSLKTDDNLDGTYETTWTSSDYRLLPPNASGEPYTAIQRKAAGNYTFPTTDYAVEVTGVFGYGSSVPPAIVEACILASMRVWKRRDLLFGVAGSAELGTLTAITPILRDGELRMLLDSIPMRITR